MKFYNSLTNELEDFLPLDPPNVKMYVCGITAYDSPHLGHARSAVAFDLIRKYLEYKGYQVKYVQNYTDIDDKMINRANERGIDIYELAAQYIAEYEELQKALRIKTPDVKPRATQEIPEMIELIQKLEDKGFTYTTNGSVYFDTSKMPGYNDIFQYTANRDDIDSDIEADQTVFTQSDYLEDKKNIADFVLWKAEKPGEPSWDSPWGKGRVGWHLECSAMAMKYLGEQIDIHGGGKDLKVPHHKNEIAQSESATGLKFSQMWLHNGFLTINASKMSKSLGNFIPLVELLQKYSGSVLRFYFLSSYYQRPIDFSPEQLDQAQKNLERFRRFVQNIKSHLETSDEGDEDSNLTEQIEEQISEFFAGMDEDLNTPKAFSALYTLMAFVGKEFFTPQKPFPTALKTKLNEFTTQIDQFLCVLEPDNASAPQESNQKLTDLINSLLEFRKEMKTAKNYEMADKIRDLLQQQGIKVTDVGRETNWEFE